MLSFAIFRDMAKKSKKTGEDSVSSTPVKSEVTETIAASPGTIQITIKDQANRETQYKVKHTAKMEKIFTAYSQKFGVAPGSLRFMFDGRRLQDSDTVGAVGLENGSVIDAMSFQLAGGL